MLNFQFPKWSRDAFLNGLLSTRDFGLCPYTGEKPSVEENAQKAAILLRDSLALPTTEILERRVAFQILELLESGNPSTFLLSGVPLDEVLPPTPHNPDLRVPPGKQTTVMEYFTAALHYSLGYRLWSDPTLYHGNWFQPVCARQGQEGVANSRGSLELGIHSDNATSPPAFFTLSCERPPIQGGKTIYIDSVAAVQSLPLDTIEVLSREIYAFDLIGGGVYADECRSFLLPIVEFDNSGAIKIVRIQSRKDSILPQGQEAETAYRDFRRAIASAEKYEVVWKRGVIVGSDNQKWCHCRTAFNEPPNHPQGRWLLKVYSDR